MEHINSEYDSLHFLRDVYWASKKYYDISNGIHLHKEYFVASNKYLDTYFEKNLKERYIYSLISFKSEVINENYSNNSPIGSTADYNFNEEIDNEGFKKNVKLLFQEAKSGEVINLTQLLLTKQNSHDFYLFSSENCIKKMSFWDENLDKGFNLSNLIWFEDKKDFWECNHEAVKSFRESIDNENFYKNENDLKFSNYLWHYKNVEVEYMKMFPSKSFYVHFIRPSVNEFQYNILLSLVTNEPLRRNEFSDINYFLYRILSNTVIEKIKESEKLKSQESINMSTHILKTHISEAVLSEIEILNQRKESYNIDIDTSVLEENCKNLFTLTGILNLLTKINDKKLLLKTGLKDELFSELLVNYNLETKINEFNKKNEIKRNGIIKPKFNSNNKCISIKIKNYYLTEIVCNAFLHTLCENLLQHSEKNNDDEISVEISINEHGFTITNIAREIFFGDENRLTGNLHLFKKLIEETESGTFKVFYPTAGQSPKIFKIIYLNSDQK